MRIAIDDFGTGYSSLAYFQSLCVDVVKIDRSFVRDLGTNTDHQALTRTILSLVEGFEMTAIAEGVETDGELAELSHLGCRFAQGYLFSRPVEAAALHVLFEHATVWATRANRHSGGSAGWQSCGSLGPEWEVLSPC